MTNPDQILIVDDNIEMLNLLDNCLASLGYDITLCANGWQALELLKTGRFTVAILDLMLPDINGIEILRRTRGQRPEIEIIVLTANASLETAIEAVRLGAYDYIIKPFHFPAIRSTITRAVEKQHLKARLTAIQDLSREMTLSLDVEQVAETVLDFAGRVLEFQDSGLWLIDEEQNELYRLTARGTGREASPRLPLSGEKGITVAAARSGEALYVPDVQEDPRYVALGAANRAELAVPLKAKGCVIGVLDVESADIHAFSPDDVKLLSTLAAQAGVAIENARLYEQAQQEIKERKQIEETLRYRVEFENLITTVATYFINLPPDEIDDGINHALQAIGELARVDHGYVFMFAHNGREINSTHGWRNAEIESQIDAPEPLPIERLPWLMSKLDWFETAYIPCVAELPPQASSDKETWWLKSARSAVAIPMAFGKSLIGFLGFGSGRAEKRWSEEDIRLLKTVGEIFANALMHKRANEALRAAKDAAEEANRAKSEFLARMSHEIRTPIHSVMGITELMLDTKLTTEQREYMDIISSSSNSLLSIINDILDFSRIEARRLELIAIDFDLQTIVNQAAEMMAQRAQEKGLNLNCILSSRVPTALVGDPGRLRQVLINLIGNAIKFTEQGEVTVQVDVEMEHDEHIDLHFAVRDTGIGISEEKQPLIFEAFRQGDGSATREYGGTGLGLTISQQLVELMGGRIRVQSVVGEGSTFHFTVTFQKQTRDRPKTTSLAEAAACIPLAGPDLQGSSKDGASRLPPAEMHRACVEKPPAPMHILLAEDNAAGQLIGQRMLEKVGHIVQVARDGLETLQMLEQGEFELILMDLEMPGMDGLQVTRAIRAREATSGHADGQTPSGNRNIPIIAMTAYAMKEDREKCLEAGMDGYLSKPVSPEKLYDAITHLSTPLRDLDAEPLAVAIEIPSAGIDLDTALEVVGGDRELLQEAVKLFLEQDCPRQLRDLRAGLEQQDAQVVRKAAHGLKGPLGSFGGRMAHDWALRLETLGRQGELGGAQSALEELKAEIGRFAAFFDIDCRTWEESNEF